MLRNAKYFYAAFIHMIRRGLGKIVNLKYTAAQLV